MFDTIRAFFSKRNAEFDESAMDALLVGGDDSCTSITKAEAMNIPAVSTAISFIAGTIAGLPIKFYRINDDGSIQEDEKDYRLSLLNDSTGDLLDANQWKFAMIVDYLLEGNAYTVVNKVGNTIKSINYVDNMYVAVTPSVNPIFKSVWIYINGQEFREFNVMRLVRNSKDGVIGEGVLKQNPLLFNAMYNALKYENNSIKYGNKKGFLKSKYKLDDKAFTNLKDAWKKLFSTNANNNDIMVLNEGISFESASSTALENQLDESKQTNSELVYNVFGLPAVLFSNNRDIKSDVYITTIKSAILPIVSAFNTMLNKFMLLEKEKGNVFFAMDTSEILKADISERYASYETALKSGWMQIDEVRKKENMPPLGLDFVKMNLADAMYYPKTKEIYIANTNAVQKLGEGTTIGNPKGKEENIDAN